MKAFVLQNGILQHKEMNEMPLQNKNVRIAMKAVGLNRRDLYIKHRVGEQADPLTLGSDGAGIVIATGKDVTTVQEGDEVIINPSLRWFYQSAAPPSSFDILGMPDHGTFAEEIVIDEEQVERKPAHLTWEEASVVGLSALTAFRAMFTQGELQADQTVFIPGGSSGVATYLIQFALAIGARVIVTTRDEEKANQLKEIGVDLVLFTQTDWQSQLENERIDLVIESVGAATFNESLAVLKPGGRMVVFGATAGDEIEINLRSFFYGQYQLFGSTMGSREELRSALQLMKEHEIHPIIGKVYPFEKMTTAFADLETNKFIGKLSLQID